MKKPNRSQWLLLRDGLKFQVKLGLDAVRDLLLSPVAIVFIAIDLLQGKQRGLFHRLMEFGHKTDRWINLFGLPNEWEERRTDEDLNVDRLFAQVEKLLKDGQCKGGLTAGAKVSIDAYLNKLINKTRSGKSDSDNIDDADAGAEPGK
jgi:hypothetical protein